MKKILIIEDDMVFGRSIGNWLKKQGMECRHVTALAPARKALAVRMSSILSLPISACRTETVRNCSGGCTRNALQSRS